MRPASNTLNNVCDSMPLCNVGKFDKVYWLQYVSVPAVD